MTDQAKARRGFVEEINILKKKILELGKESALLKLTKDALRESDEKYRRIFENSVVGFFQSKPEGRFIDVNPAFARMLRYESPEDVLSSITDIATQYYANPRDRERYKALLVEYGHVEAFEFKVRCKDGSEIWVSNSTWAYFDQGGEVIRHEGIVVDITKRKHAEEEQKKLESQLTQAQKMESVGRLAGGVAHDFNNMLGIILGHAEMALDTMDPSQPLYSSLTEIQQAAKRSTELTKQLLAFARKQTIAPKVLDLNESVESILKMLRRLVGEDIDLVWRPGKNLWPVKMDSTQIDQILANLCSNARDAIRDVGRITIETRNIVLREDDCIERSPWLVPREYVLLTVSDDGMGINKRDLENIFDPFFTTKEVGKGTGLGLPMVYGIVKQNRGFINAYSEVEQGTIFRIYLPRHVEEPEAEGASVEAKPIRGGHETVLLVEDEPILLKMGKTMLEKLGYQVLSSVSPSEAIKLAETHPDEIDLLITDIIMPKMNGRDMAARIKSLYPELKCLFMSGYTAEMIAHHGVLEEGLHFMQKPFSIEDLANRIREALES